MSSSSTVGARTQVRSLQHIRHQANRGFLYSTSILLPDPTNRGVRMFGTFVPGNGTWIELVGNGTGYFVNFVVRNHWKDSRVDITNLLPKDTDISKGHLWDIQMEWRGVGNIKVFYDLKLIYERKALGTLDEVIIENPSLPASFECINSGDEVVIKSGCVDISSEGGGIDKRYYNSVSTGTTLIRADNTPERGSALIAVRLPKTINYGELVDVSTGLPDIAGTNSLSYTRDIILDSITSFCKDESFTIVNASRGVYLPNISTLAGWTKADDSYAEYIVGGLGSDLDVAFQLDYASTKVLHASRQEMDMSHEIDNPNKESAPFFFTSDSYVIVSVKPDGNNKLAGVNIEFSEEV